MIRANWAIQKNKFIKNSGKLNSVHLARYFEECTSCSKLHGAQFLGEKNRTVLEKIFWFVTIAICIVICSYFIHEAYQKWEQSPMVVKIGSKQISVDQIVFPAITVCPASKITREMVALVDKIDGKSDRSRSLDQLEKLKFKHLQMWCPHANFELFNATFDLHEAYNLDSLRFIYNSTPSMSETIYQCLWNDAFFNCADRFVPTLTEDGVCYTFNGLDRSQILKNIVSKYENFNGIPRTSCYSDFSPSCSEKYPLRTNSGYENGLTVYFNYTNGKENPCTNSWNGHKVIVHKPNELAILRENYHSIPLSQSRILAISPQVILTDKYLRVYPPEQRKCYFAGERELAYFEDYTQSNCRTECLFLNNTFGEKCSEFYSPHISANETICNATISNTIKKRRQNLKINAAEDSLTALNTLDISVEAQKMCQCYPLCKSLTYDVTYLTDDKEFPEGFSKLHIYFKEPDFYPYERTAVFATVDFIVYCASLLSVFTGFSFIVFFEVVYFVCLRPLFNIFIARRRTGIKLANGHAYQ